MFKWLWRHRIRILLNIAAWFFLLLTTYFNSKDYPPATGSRALFLLHVILFNLCYIALVGMNVFWLMPRFLFRKKYGAYIGLFAATVLGWSFILGPYMEWLLRRFPGTDTVSFSSVSFGVREAATPMIVYCLGISATIMLLPFIFGIGRLAQQYFEVTRQKEEIEKRQIAAELSLLKSQINPHFLFNVLNSIYSLALKKSDDTPGVVLRLSEIMRYMLYDTRHNLVPLENEVQMISDYLDIERMRISKSQQVNCTISGNISGHSITPAILITFVENAIKHGTDSMAENAFIRIHIGMQDNLFTFHCINNYKVRQKLRPESSGIGLENVRKRLELLYNERQRLVIRDEENIFEVTLTIKSPDELPDRR